MVVIAEEHPERTSRKAPREENGALTQKPAVVRQQSVSQPAVAAINLIQATSGTAGPSITPEPRHPAPPPRRTPPRHCGTPTPWHVYTLAPLTPLHPATP
ncbi:hypothetical protein E2C01_098089 [Portunus trituberculatus]|uniref:Uncharacterized protein n=1 Tax=Portunus trituberculatus TaxID=210409 RepID=A0A5B7JWW2_PORTR|nr:hypothetical protein [Portunus trituberculatus]